METILELKPPGEPASPFYKKVYYEGNKVDAETFLIREQTCVQEYTLVREPNCRPFTRVSLFKSQSYPIEDRNLDLRMIQEWSRS